MHEYIVDQKGKGEGDCSSVKEAGKAEWSRNADGWKEDGQDGEGL